MVQWGTRELFAPVYGGSMDAASERSPTTPRAQHDIPYDGSEDDDYYVPQQENGSDCEASEGARRSKKARLSGPMQNEQPPTKSAEQIKAERDALWAEFQASVSSSSIENSRGNKPKTVKVRVAHEFAGEEVIEIKEVQEGSAEATKWPMVVEDKGDDQAGGSTPCTSTPADTGASAALFPGAGPSVSVLPEARSINDAPPLKKPTPTSATRRPGRPKGSSLAALVAATKPKKISTLEKSRLDWDAHLASTPSKEEVDELERDRKDGAGYLDRMDYLKRVDERKEAARIVTKRKR
ncbi:hypothetical protein FRB90_005906 [Tulasnella sp. 427]|nr:hypothetical protein FRB90_005906 [Tulasnella sp. 427]